MVKSTDHGERRWNARTKVTEDDGAADAETARESADGGRYTTLKRLGGGGFGEVYRVLDNKLGRMVAMKTIRPEHCATIRTQQRFRAEIALTARLEHPGIVAVYDCGKLDDGRLWFTMPEVRGSTLSSIIARVFDAPAHQARTRRRWFLDKFVRMCETMAYAHSRGVIHRDLKPDNIMVGEFGQVMIMDWGIARDCGAPACAPTEQTHPSDDRSSALMTALTAHGRLTREGDIVGTAAYMAPEQLRGHIEHHGPATDVYALGAILYCMLIGHPPLANTAPSSYSKPRAPIPVNRAAAPGLEVPDDLETICMRALALERERRFPDAGALAANMADWLDGAARRERALARLSRAREQLAELAASRAHAAELRARAKACLDGVQPWAKVDDKLAGWRFEDRADELDRQTAQRETEWLQTVHGALAEEPGLPEAHALLADHYCHHLLDAERRRDWTSAARFEVLLQAHDRGRYAAVLSGRGALTLVTDPPGAQVLLYRHRLKRRRLVPELVREIGPTPIVELSLEQGSYLLEVRAPGRAPIRYPALIERGAHWHGCPPGASDPFPIPLPRRDELGDDEIYVCAGWTVVGGDRDAPDSLPTQAVWIDGFIIGRHPVTNREYLAYLNDLVARGHDARALAACPRANRGSVSSAREAPAIERVQGGGFRLPARPSRIDPGKTWHPRGPVVQIDWHGARSYADWLAERTGRGVRLANELEREKAVRGVDGRCYPWGDHFDPTWACMLDSHPGETARVPVDDYPSDHSPYGLRGGAGNSRDWCANLWTREGPAVRQERLIIDPLEPAGTGEYRAVRGGAWSSVAHHCRGAARFANRPDARRSAIGARVARSYPDTDSSETTVNSDVARNT